MPYLIAGSGRSRATPAAAAARMFERLKRPRSREANANSPAGVIMVARMPLTDDVTLAGRTSQHPLIPKVTTGQAQRRAISGP